MGSILLLGMRGGMGGGSVPLEGLEDGSVLGGGHDGVGEVVVADDGLWDRVVVRSSCDGVSDGAEDCTTT